MQYDYSKLITRIISKFGSRYRFCLEMEITPQTLVNKLRNKIPFNQAQIEAFCKCLDIPRSEIGEYFFTLK